MTIKELAYKDLEKLNKEESLKFKKYWNKMEREQPLLAHFLYNLDRFLWHLKALRVFWNKERQALDVLVEDYKNKV
jgi:hypothetical protein